MLKMVIGLLAVTLLLTSCGDKKEVERLTTLNKKLSEENAELKADLSAAKSAREKLDFLAAKLRGLKARVVTNYGNIELEFFSEKAPITVANFICRAESGYYNKSQFHRVIPGFMIQGGDPNTKDKNVYNDGQGGPIFNIPHEFNDIKHTRGVISMARVSAINAGAGCQFFIMHDNAPHLDGQYTAFGRVTSGLEVVDKIANVPTNKKDPRLRDHPLKPVVIKRIEVFR